MRSLLVLLVAFVLLLTAGCGGGGGGSIAPTTTTLNVLTAWTGPSDPTGNAGLSEVITLRQMDGTLIISKVLDRSSGNSIDFDGISVAQYRVTVSLYNATEGNGTLLLTGTTAVTAAPSAQLRIEVGGTPNTISVAPGTANVEVENTANFTAAAISSTGALILSDPNAFTWSVLGGIGSVTNGGVFTATTAGDGFVRATETASGKTGSTAVTATPRSITRSTWTVLVYMNAANDLYPYSDLNVDQMERVADNPNARFVVQWKQSKALFPSSTFDGTRRLLVTPNTASGVQSTVIQDMGSGVDMGLASTLRDFIDWGKRNYPADHTLLVVWNHGRGWKRGDTEAPVRSVSEDWQSGNQIQIWELSSALQGEGLDALAWDASLMQMMEVNYEIKDYVGYIAGSEESPPGEGFPYDLALKPMRDNPNATTATLMKGFVDAMTTYAPYAPRKITQSVVDTSKLGALATAMDTLADALIANSSSATAAVQNARINAQSYSPTGTRYYRDLYDVCAKLIAESSTPSVVRTAAVNVQNALTAAIVWEGHNSNSPGSHGLSVDFSAATSFTSYAADYRNMKFAQDTHWVEFLNQAP